MRSGMTVPFLAAPLTVPRPQRVRQPPPCLRELAALHLPRAGLAEHLADGVLSIKEAALGCPHPHDGPVECRMEDGLPRRGWGWTRPCAPWSRRGDSGRVIRHRSGSVALSAL